MLRITIHNSRQQRELSHAAGPLEFGRVMQGGHDRVVIDDPFVSRDQLRVTEEQGRLHLENLSRHTPIHIAGCGRQLGVTAVEDFDLPLEITVGTTHIRFENMARAEGPTSWQTILQPARVAEATVAPLNLVDEREPLTPERLTQWFETVISVQRAAAGSAEFYEETVKAVVQLIGLDGAQVLLRRGEAWEVVASFARHAGRPLEFSRTALAHMIEEKRTFFRTLDVATTQSLTGIEAVVVSPIFDPHGEVVGAVYGQRYRMIGTAGSVIEPLEAQLVQLLAAAVGAGLARQQKEAEAARSRVQFEQFFSSALANQLQADPTLLEGRDREVTALFSDIRSFSGLSERLSPEETCRLVGDVMERLTARIADHGGVVVDYIGDGLLAMWNAPAIQPDHATLACRAALAMIDELPALNRDWQGILGAPFGIGIGINTGVARVGNIGSRRRFKYGPLGHAVNLASRLEGLTKQLGVAALVSESTWKKLHGAFATRRLCRVRVVGIASPLDVFELHSAGEDPQWNARRDAYESALAQFETGHWADACRTLYPLVAEQPNHYDVPSLTLIGRAVDCLKTRPTKFEPVLDFVHK
ncbi:MAG TPA: adenylate/guanylate cyclase domain-containing protein [Pirellulales bacterium]|nr:adenylate/guanylate cyclase domain-containing protein [Pirellulales bacterium]